MANEHQDKRSVSTDALETLGMVHFRDEKRDAIHLAVIPVTAAKELQPGEHIGVKNGRASGLYEPHVGIVDPFLGDGPLKGDRFWLVIYPRKITSLRHVWSHPELPDEAPVVPTPAEDDEDKQTAKAWIFVQAERMGLSYGKLLEYAVHWLETDGLIVQYGSESWREEFDAAGFWPRYEIVTGMTVPKHKQGAFFSCTC